MAPTIYAFVQPGCPACAAFKPKLKKVAREHGNVKTRIINVDDANPQVQALADRMRIEATPTIVVEGAGRPIRHEGDMPIEKLRGLYGAAHVKAPSNTGVIVAAAASALALGITTWLLLRPKR